MKNYQIICISCGHSKLIDNAFINNIKEKFKIDTDKNLNEIQNRLICSQCYSKRIKIQSLQEEKPIIKNVKAKNSINWNDCIDDANKIISSKKPHKNNKLKPFRPHQAHELWVIGEGGKGRSRIKKSKKIK